MKCRWLLALVAACAPAGAAQPTASPAPLEIPLIGPPIAIPPARDGKPASRPAVLTDVVQVEVNLDTACALRADGDVYCWGHDPTKVTTGYSATCPECLRQPRKILGLGKAKQIDVGFQYACALEEAGTVACWGKGLANMQVVREKSDGVVRLVDDGGAPILAKRIATAVHLCIVTPSGDAMCRGNNSDGQAGAPMKPRPPNGGVVATPKWTKVVSGAEDVVVGGQLTCAKVPADKTGWQCWGDDFKDADQSAAVQARTAMRPRHVPRSVDLTAAGGKSPVSAMSIGDGHVCAVDAAHDVYCWGWNVSGQAGPGPTGQEAYRLKQSHRVTPARVALPSSDFVAVAAARYSTCALGQRGDVFCWGGNNDGVLGSGLLPEEPGSPDGTTPVRVVGLDDASALSAGSAIACALRRGAGTEARTVACWGGNEMFGLGRGLRRELPAPGRREGTRALGEPTPGLVAAPLADRPVTSP